MSTLAWLRVRVKSPPPMWRLRENASACSPDRCWGPASKLAPELAVVHVLGHPDVDAAELVDQPDEPGEVDLDRERDGHAHEVRHDAGLQLRPAPGVALVDPVGAAAVRVVDPGVAGDVEDRHLAGRRVDPDDVQGVGPPAAHAGALVVADHEEEHGLVGRAREVGVGRVAVSVNAGSWACAGTTCPRTTPSTIPPPPPTSGQGR